MESKVLIPLMGEHVAPRFDLATEVLILAEDAGKGTDKLLVLPHASAEQLCQLVLTEGVQTLICGAIEEEYYQYLTWKKIRVIDSVIGPVDLVREQYKLGRLQSGTILQSSEQTIPRL